MSKLGGLTGGNPFDTAARLLSALRHIAWPVGGAGLIAGSAGVGGGASHAREGYLEGLERLEGEGRGASVGGYFHYLHRAADVLERAIEGGRIASDALSVEES